MSEHEQSRDVEEIPVEVDPPGATAEVEASSDGVARVRNLLLGSDLLDVDQRLTRLEARIDREVSQVRESVTRSITLLQDVLRHEL